MRARARFVVPVASVAVVLAAYGLGPWPGLTHAGAVGAPTHYVLSPDSNGQFAAAGSLGTTGSVDVTLTVEDAQNTPVPNATVYLAFTNSDTLGNGAGTATVAGQCGQTTTPLTAASTACTSSANNGTISINYKAPTAAQTGGFDTISATDVATGSPNISASVLYHLTALTHFAFTGDNADFYSFGGLAIFADAGKLPPTTTSINLSVCPEDCTTPLSQTFYVSFSSSGTTHGTLLSQGCGGAGTPVSSTPSPVSTAGKNMLCYIPPASGTDVDTVTVQDTATHPDVTNLVGYNTTTPDGVKFSPASVIAPAGSLGVSGSQEFLAAPTHSGTPAPFAEAKLSLAPVPGTANSGNAWGSATADGANLPTTASTIWISGSDGTIPISYTSASSPLSTGTDKASAAVGALTPATDYYDYSTAVTYQFTNAVNNNFFAARNTLTSLPASNTVTLTAFDGSSPTPQPVPHTTVYMQFSQTTNGGTVVVTDAGGATTWSSSVGTWTPFATNDSGQITLKYTAKLSPTGATGGFDKVLIQDTADAFPTISTFLEYQYGAVDHFIFNPAAPTIAATGTLSPSDHAPIVITEVDSGGTTLTSTAVPMYVTFQSTTGGGTASSAQCASALTAGTTVKCTPDQNGVVTVTYNVPGTLPAGGTDTIAVGDSNVNPNPTGSHPSTDSYSFVGAYGPQSTLIATGGSLDGGQSHGLTLTVEDSGSNPAPDAGVWLSFSGPGSATANSAALTSTPQQFVADGSGHVALSFSAPSTLPAGGTSTITAQNASSSPSLTKAFSYAFAGTYGFSPAGPSIAPAASLGGSAVTPITLTVEDSGGNPLPGSHAFISFSQATGGGGASANGTSLTSTPQSFTADGNGRISLAYTTPGTLPKTGVDSVTVQNMQSGATLATSDSYSFAPPPPTQGYLLVASDGGLFPFGAAASHSYGSTGNVHLNEPIVGMVPTASNNGYWLVASDGGIFPFGDAQQHSYGSTGNVHLNAPIVGMERTASGNGYWLVASDGGIFPFGDAQQHSYGSTGNVHLNAPILGMKRTASGNGYWLFARDGGIFPFGDAQQHSYGSTGNMHLNAPIVGMERTASGNGYWMVASDGGIFPFGDAQQHSYGSTGNVHLNAAIVGMSRTASGNGYWLVASDGGIFPFGPDAGGWGSTGNIVLNKPIIGMASIG